MPPKKAAQPERADTAKFIDALSARLELAYAQRKSTGGQTVIRRLNRLELRNTLRDLLYLKGAAYRPGAVSGLVDNNGNGRVERKGNDPVRLFPEDELDEGFANIGDRLVMSDFLLKLRWRRRGNAGGRHAHGPQAGHRRACLPRPLCRAQAGPAHDRDRRARGV